MVFRSIVLLSILTFQSFAATRYVSPGGSGSTCSSGTPCSITEGVSQTTAAGDELILKDGTYSTGLHITANGAAGNPILIRSENHLQAMISLASGSMLRARGSYLTVRGIIFDGQSGSGGFPCIAVGESPNTTPVGSPIHDLIFEHNVVRGCRAAALQMITGEHDLIFRYNHINGTGYQDAWGEAFYVGGYTGANIVYNVQIYGNYLRDFTENGVETGDQTHDVSIHDNVFQDQVWSGDHGLTGQDSLHLITHGTLQLNGYNHEAYNNTFINCKAGIGSLVIVDTENVKAWNNIIIDQIPATELAVRMMDWGPDQPGSGASSVHNNTFYNLSTTNVGNSLTDPQLLVHNNLGLNHANNINAGSSLPDYYFFSPKNRYLELTPAAFNAIDKGSATAKKTYDYLGRAVNNLNDYGAFEFIPAEWDMSGNKPGLTGRGRPKYAIVKYGAIR